VYQIVVVGGPFKMLQLGRPEIKGQRGLRGIGSAKASPMNFAKSVPFNAFAMICGSIPFMSVESVLGVHPMIFHHHTIPGNLRNNRSGRYRGALAGPFDHGELFFH
jgi:hypothetical protein